MLEVGKHYVFNVPPAWLIGGTVAEITDTHVILKDAAYLETVGKGAMISDLPMATTTREQQEACSRAYPLPDGHTIRLDCVMQATPSVLDFRVWSRSHLAGAIKGAR